MYIFVYVYNCKYMHAYIITLWVAASLYLLFPVASNWFTCIFSVHNNFICKYRFISPIAVHHISFSCFIDKAANGSGSRLHSYLVHDFSGHVPRIRSEVGWSFRIESLVMLTKVFSSSLFPGCLLKIKLRPRLVWLSG